MAAQKSAYIVARVSPERLAEARAVATLNRKTLSAWVRDLVERAVRRNLTKARSEAESQ